MTSYIKAAYAEATKRTYSSQRKAYLRFCFYFALCPLPCEKLTLYRYTTFLARTLRPSSINQYLNVVRLMHLEAGLPNPMENNWYLDIIKKGIKRVHGAPPKQKLPITADMLMSMRQCVDTSKPFQLAFWAACVVAFFAFFRKSTLLSSSNHDPSKNLCRKDVEFTDTGAIITVRHTKTIQFGQRLLRVPLATIPGSPLCPVNALKQLFSKCPGVQSDAPLFSYTEGSKCKYVNYSAFASALKRVLKTAGYDPASHSGHSFRRGGCNLALSSGVPPVLIKMHGDWKSNAFERYVVPDMNYRFKVVKVLALAVS